MSRRRQTVLALAAVLVVAGGAGAWALTGTRSDVPVVAAPSEGEDGLDASPSGGEDGLDASPSARASATPSASEPAEASEGPSSSADDVLAGRIAGLGMGSGSNGAGSDPSGGSGGTGSFGGGATDGGAGTGGGSDPGTPTSATSPTPTTTASPTSTRTTDPEPTTTTSSPSPSSPPTQQPNRAPRAAYVTRVASGTKTVTFDASSSSDPDGDALTYIWTFNDGTSSKSGKDKAVITHQFTIDDDNTSGRWTVTLTVRDGRGGSHSVSAPSSISMPNIHRMKMWDASKAVRGAGLNAFYSKVYNDATTGYDGYDVFSQWPAASTTLSADANVRIAFWASEAECVNEPEHATEWCYEDPPPSPTLDKF